MSFTTEWLSSKIKFFVTRLSENKSLSAANLPAIGM